MIVLDEKDIQALKALCYAVVNTKRLHSSNYYNRKYKDTMGFLEAVGIVQDLIKKAEEEKEC